MKRWRIKAGTRPPGGYRGVALAALGSGGVAATAALSLPALGSVLFLNADKAEAAPVLADDAGALDSLIETAKELLEPFRVA
jgi:hypothetical protein